MELRPQARARPLSIAQHVTKLSENTSSLRPNAAFVRQACRTAMRTTRASLRLMCSDGLSQAPSSNVRQRPRSSQWRDGAGIAPTSSTNCCSTGGPRSRRWRWLRTVATRPRANSAKAVVCAAVEEAYGLIDGTAADPNTRGPTMSSEFSLYVGSDSKPPSQASNPGSRAALSDTTWDSTNLLLS